MHLVCACDETTYSNSCMAHGLNIVHSGPCDSSEEKQGGKGKKRRNNKPPPNFE